ncbi:MAG: NADH-ubiquinone oxidoreductase-F iron-sulfur binding region domain-containing protein [bacterium]
MKGNLTKLEAAETFYHLAGPSLPPYCQGIACFVARHLRPERFAQAEAQTPRLYCLGRCFAAPAALEENPQPNIEIRAPRGVVLDRIVKGEAGPDYASLRRALGLAPEEVVREVEASELRGRGGAGFPAGKKWRAVLQQDSSEKFVVANADEGDPGAYIDRFILERDPHLLLEGLRIAAHAVGAQRGFVYLRREYPEALEALRRALREAAGLWPGGFDVEIVIGQGSYVCGEETALLNSIEGERPEVRTRPPYPTERGLYQRPTLVNNVETLAAIPWILREGGAAYRSFGFSQSRGTKVLSLNSLFRRPGLYEVEFGIKLREVVEGIGGGLRSGALQGLIVGGPLAGVIPPSLLDTPLGFEELRAIGAEVGHGGVVAFDERTSILELARHVFSFGAYESCGKCTPCRLGSRRMEEFFAGAGGAGERPRGLMREFERLVAALRQTSLCGHGTGLAAFAASLDRYYRKELEACLG